MIWFSKRVLLIGKVVCVQPWKLHKTPLHREARKFPFYGSWIRLLYYESLGTSLEFFYAHLHANVCCFRPLTISSDWFCWTNLSIDTGNIIWTDPSIYTGNIILQLESDWSKKINSYDGQPFMEWNALWN